MIYLDTHVAVHLYTHATSRFPESMLQLLEQERDIRISPMVRLEIEYLYEIGRLNEHAIQIVDALESSMGLVVCAAPFPAIAKTAESLSWTRDPFDRLIVAHAALHDARLVTRDENIHRNYDKAVWSA